MRFGVGIPTCREGLNHPVPFAGPKEIVLLAQMAERLGFYAVWANDHRVPPPDSLARFSRYPSFYEALISLAFVAAATEHVRLGVGVVVMPLREPVLLAKQAATLDVISGGRFLLGVGLGSLRYEFEALNPSRRNVHRGNMLSEGLEALNILLTQDEANYKGKHYEFSGVSLYPRPIQRPFPIYTSGGNPEVPRRVARWCTGWLTSATTGDGIRKRWETLLPALEEVGRDPSTVEMGAITTLCVARTHEEAVRRFEAATLPRVRTSRSADAYLDSYFIGSPADLIDRVGQMEKAGLSQCITQNIAANTFEELVAMVQMYGEEVVSAFKAH